MIDGVKADQDLLQVVATNGTMTNTLSLEICEGITGATILVTMALPGQTPTYAYLAPEDVKMIIFGTRINAAIGNPHAE